MVSHTSPFIQFDQFLVNLNSRIESSLRNTQLKYQEDLDSIHRSYHRSLNDLHSITGTSRLSFDVYVFLFLLAEQVQEMHQSLEFQYCQRLSEMRNRYESKLHCSLPFT